MNPQSTRLIPLKLVFIGFFGWLGLVVGLGQPDSISSDILEIPHDISLAHLELDDQDHGTFHDDPHYGYWNHLANTRKSDPTFRFRLIRDRTKVRLIIARHEMLYTSFKDNIMVAKLDPYRNFIDKIREA